MYTTSKMKCGIEEAIFIKKIADTLSENKLVSSMCRHIKLTHCNTAKQIAFNVFTTILNLVLVIWSYKI